VLGESLMLDASKYAEHFPEETAKSESAAAEPAPAPHIVRPSLLAALHDLEMEFREILARAQQPDAIDPSA